jgi:hypothetical protein
MTDDQQQIVRTTITTTLAKLAVGVSFADLDELIAAVEPLVMSNTSHEVDGVTRRLSWRELCEHTS